MDNKELINFISYLQLLNESIEMYEIIFALIKLDKEISGLLSIPLVPFLSFVVDGIIQFFPETFDLYENDLNLDSGSFKKLIGNIRVGHKLLSDKRNSQKLNIVRRIQNKNYKNLTSDYNDFQNLLIKSFGQEDFGIFRYKKIEFATNIQGYLYLDTLSNNDTYTDKKSQMLIQLSSSLSSLLSSFVIGSKSSFNYEINTNLSIDANIKDFELSDYFLFDVRRKNIFNDKSNAEVQVLLHSHLCQLNFLGEVLPNIFDKKFHCLLRFKLVAFLESIKVLNYSINHEERLGFHKGTMQQILNGKVYNLLSKSRIRNNIAHYQLQEYSNETFSNNNSIVSIIEFETKEPFITFYGAFENEYSKITDLFYEVLFK